MNTSVRVVHMEDTQAVAPVLTLRLLCLIGGQYDVTHIRVLRLSHIGLKTLKRTDALYRCVSLVELDLQYNALQGDFPLHAEVLPMTSLEFLDLSHNRLEGLNILPTSSETNAHDESVHKPVFTLHPLLQKFQPPCDDRETGKGTNALVCIRMESNPLRDPYATCESVLRGCGKIRTIKFSNPDISGDIESVRIKQWFQAHLALRQVNYIHRIQMLTQRNQDVVLSAEEMDLIEDLERKLTQSWLLPTDELGRIGLYDENQENQCTDESGRSTLVPTLQEERILQQKIQELQHLVSQVPIEHHQNS